MATSSQHVINIDDLSASTEKELEMLDDLTDDCCISRVPEILRKFNEHYYTPKVVSIGPIHHGKQELRAMEVYKKRYLKDFLRLSSATLKECYELVHKNETKLRNFYADPIELNSKDFVKIVLLDAVFLLMTILCSKTTFQNMPMGGKRIFEKPTMIHDIKFDLVLLENQLPFFIMEELYKLSNIHRNCNISSIEFTGLKSRPEEGIYITEETAIVTLLAYIFNSMTIKYISTEHLPAKGQHLLALFRSCLKPIDWKPTKSPQTSHNMPSIKELSQAGVKFKAVGGNLLDIKFNNGVLEIPALGVHGAAELLFRNLIAFELCNGPDILFIDYFILMQKFTAGSEDAEVLIRNKIIVNSLPDAQAVSTLFQNISYGFVYEDSTAYSDVIREVNAFYAVRWNRWKATWIQRYFKAPWAIFSFAAALLLLILTFVQAVCSIAQVT